jgi:hypothetical protein
VETEVMPKLFIFANFSIITFLDSGKFSFARIFRTIIAGLRKLNAVIYSYQEMADELKLLKATYQGYDTGRSPTPRIVMFEALKVLRRNRNFWRGMPKRIDANLKNGICPNDARPLPGSKLLTTGRYYEVDI